MDVASTSLGSVLSGARVARVPLSRLHGYPRANKLNGIALGEVTRDHPGVVSKDAAMLGQIVQRMTAPFRRKRCPECGHKLRENYCDVCGYDLIEQTRDKLLHRRGPA